MQPPRPRVAEHQPLVRRHVLAPHLDDATPARRRVERRDEVVEQIVDRYRLHARVEPSRADHDRQTLHEIADHLERDAARPDDHRGAELRDRDPARAQRTTALLPRAQMRREVRPRPQPAEVDDVPDARLCGGLPERAGSLDVQLVEPGAGAAPHAVDEVVRRVDARERLGQRPAVEHVPDRHLDLPGPRTRAHALPVADEDAHAALLLQQPGHQPPADVPRSSGDQDRSRSPHPILTPGSPHRPSPASGHGAAHTSIVRGLPVVPAKAGTS